MIFLRSLAFNIVMYTAGVLLCLYGNLIKPFRPTRVLAVGHLWAVITLAALTRLCRIHIDITGREFLPTSGPALIAAQHQSAFDTLLWLTLLPRPAYVLKQELLKMPLFGPLLRPSGFIPVNRAGGAAALRKVLTDCQTAAAQNRQIIIFPEGTRVPPGERVPLQPGIAGLAKTLNLPVIPATTNSGQFWPRQAFQKSPGRLQVTIHPPLPAGLPRDHLLTHLTHYFYGAAVDNSVGEAETKLINDPKKDT